MESKLFWRAIFLLCNADLHDVGDRGSPPLSILCRAKGYLPSYYSSTVPLLLSFYTKDGLLTVSPLFLLPSRCHVCLKIDKSSLLIICPRYFNCLFLILSLFFVRLSVKLPPFIFPRPDFLYISGRRTHTRIRFPARC